MWFCYLAGPMSMIDNAHGALRPVETSIGRSFSSAQPAPPTFQYLMKHFVILAVIGDHYGKTNIYANANI